MKYWQTLKKERLMINTDSMLQNTARRLISTTLMTFLSTFSPTLDSTMMLMLTFLEMDSLVKRKDKVLVALEGWGALVDSQVSETMISFLRAWVVSAQALFQALLLEEMVAASQNRPAQWQKQCNCLLISRNGKTVTVKKTTTVNPDGSK